VARLEGSDGRRVEHRTQLVDEPCDGGAVAIELPRQRAPDAAARLELGVGRQQSCAVEAAGRRVGDLTGPPEVGAIGQERLDD